MYGLADIDFSNVLVISSREPMSDEVDSEDESLDANLRNRSAPSLARELEKAVFGAAVLARTYQVARLSIKLGV